MNGTDTDHSSAPHHKFCVPERRIITPEDLACFHQSQVYSDLVSFISNCSRSVNGKPNSSTDIPHSSIAAHLVDLLSHIESIVEQTPPLPDLKSRFGNPAFRMFYDRLKQALPSFLQPFVSPHAAIDEVAKYLEKSFGDRKRIDYGTGHEANFMAFLLCLHKLDLISVADLAAVVLKAFNRYIQLMRKIQFTYWLEPAGSHGVWGLDDYQSLPFLFGASQLVPHPHLRPNSIRNAEMIDEFADEYMYFGCIAFIHQVKPSASLRWHSPMLDDISSAKSWSKVEAGMLKLYINDVLGKLPIMQHFLFGSILHLTNVSNRSVRDEDLEAMDGHLHVYAMGQQFPVCCGMRLPSAIAARQREGNPRSVIPFD